MYLLYCMVVPAVGITFLMLQSYNEKTTFRSFFRQIMDGTRHCTDSASAYWPVADHHWLSIHNPVAYILLSAIDIGCPAMTKQLHPVSPR